MFSHTCTELQNNNAHMATNKQTYVSKCRTETVYQIPIIAMSKINELSSKEN